MKAIRDYTLTLVAILTFVSGSPAWAEGGTGHRSATTAILVSMVATAVPVAQGIHDWNKTDGDHGAAAVLGGYVLGPAVGHYYAGNPGAAWGGIGLRLVPVLGLGVASAASWDDPNDEAANAVAVGSIVVGAAITVWDIARASKSVRSYNEQAGHVRLSLGAVRGDRELTPVVRVDLPM